MPSLSWNEIKTRAIQFSRAWSTETREQAEKQTFWNEFFLVFGIPRRTVASFEEPVQRIKRAIDAASEEPDPAEFTATLEEDVRGLLGAPQNS